MANATTIGTLTLKSTINCISVISYFTGDDNEDNSAVLYYKVTGAGSWTTGIDLVCDRRALVTIYGSGTEANPYDNTYRTFIYNLTPNASYDIKVTYTDGDGGGGDATDTISTKRNNPASSGTTYYVRKSGFDEWPGTSDNPWLTVNYAASQVSAGDTVKIGAGTYTERVTAITSGTVNNYVVFESEDYNDKAVVTYSSGGTFVLNSVSYNRFRYLDVNTTGDGQPFRIWGNSVGNIVEHNDMDMGSSRNWWCTGVNLYANGVSPGPSYTIIQNNNIDTSATGNSGPFGVMMYNLETNMTTIKNNTIVGGFFDCIATIPNFGLETIGQYYVYGNTLGGCYSDCVEAEGGGMNVGVWGNIMHTVRNMGIACAPVIVGPAYFFRNLLYYDGSNGQAGVKLGSSSDGHIFFYHNTFWHLKGAIFATYGSDANCDNATFRNNIVNVLGGNQYCVEEYVNTGTLDFNYNCMYSPRSSPIKWGGSVKTWAAWRTADGQEANGVWEDTSFIDTSSANFNLVTGGSCIDAGVALQGFNDADCPWPKQNGTADIGAYEFDALAAPPLIIGVDISAICGVTPNWIIGIDV